MGILVLTDSDLIDKSTNQLIKKYHDETARVLGDFFVLLRDPLQYDLSLRAAIRRIL
ncbi:MAG: hypothetical protein HPY58_03040 [Firmicutes bacterium]|nr:hypothetical protein [Bacillota bacterium]